MVSGDGISFPLEMKDRTVRLASKIHRRIYRCTRGLIGARLVRNDMLLLTTRGHRTDRPHEVPLLYFREGSGLVVIASYGGRPENPVWYENLLAEPSVTVQLGRRRFVAVARPVSPPDRERLWPRVVRAYSGYAVYQSRTDREIPLVFLQPT